MSTSGRGRGYPGRHQARERPGEDRRREREMSPHTEPIKRDTEDFMDTKPAVHEEDAALKELLTIDEQYRPLLVLLEQFSPGEDGIQFNRKLRHFESTVTSICPDETRLLQAFASFRAASLLNSSTARKLSAVGASFTRQQRQQSLRSALLNIVMQGSFSKLDILERSNPTYLINAANLMGDYFAEARLCNGNKVHILAAPLLQYMKALLISDDIRAHRSLATQLMQNGRELLSVLAQELDDLSISIRIRLLTPPPVSIIWLLLSADLCLNKFLPLPNTLQQFYASHLDLSQEETNQNFYEVTYGTWKKSPDKSDTKSESELSLAEKVSQNISQLGLSQEEDHMKPKLRPILGAGAGLLRQEQQNLGCVESFDTWTSKNMNKRYDLNSWRQNEDEKEEEAPEPVFNPSVLPPNMSGNFPAVPDYPPPNINYNNYKENYPNYLQQGDGTYIQSQFTERASFSSQGDGFQYERQNSDKPRRPVENWRKEKTDKEDTKKPWPITQDNGEPEEEEEFRSRPVSREKPKNRRSSLSEEKKRHVSDVPRSQKYWDHDDRCDIDYTS